MFKQKVIKSFSKVKKDILDLKMSLWEWVFYFDTRQKVLEERLLKIEQRLDLIEQMLV